MYKDGYPCIENHLGSKSLNEQLSNKFVCSNLLTTENIATDKFKAVLTSFKQVGANIGDTHRNARGFNILNSVQADKDGG